MDAFGSFGVCDERIVRVLTHALSEKGCVRDYAIRSLSKMGRSSKGALPEIETILLSNRDPEDDCNNPQLAAVEAVIRIAEPEEAMRILRDKIEQMADGMEVVSHIILHLETGGPQPEVNREVLERFLEESRKAETGIVKTLDSLPPATN